MKCEHFGTCGSCAIYELSYEAELSAKKERVLSLLSPFDVKELEVFSANESHYRARSEFKIWHDEGGANYAMGRLDKKGAVNITECPKVIEPIEQRMKPLLAKINSSEVLKHRIFSVEFLATTTDEVLITMIYHRKLDEVWEAEAKALESFLEASIMGRSRKQKVVLSQEYVTETLKIDNQEYHYRHYESGFTQPNPAVNIKMIEWAIKQVKTINRGDFLESYCGLGNFTIPLSKYFNRVLATEISKRSIKSANENCILNGVSNIEFIRLASEEMTQAINKIRIFRRLEGIDLESYRFSTVLVDPPRAGLDEDTINLIANIDNIIYISCNPETLARDLVLLSKTHTVEASAIFDQFPHTHHIESGVFLKKIILD
ncbi:MAG TPA: tRNA (uridine(54)-C5)-methyltransferase TrmA [Campylobacterales bacterium]|nr:tRNA (uridine(54)-C5)-methyltransferase TrmA [Campylobacterales bacterium]HIP41352.1 tRNA (uridine(54)-C5)-methyltransferase TrmA [Campylobacterales bacterium]